jgi:hypothetical protein
MHFRDLWRVKIKDFHSQDELKFLFLLELGEYNYWPWLINSLLECWIKELRYPTFKSYDGEWLSIYNDMITSNPIKGFDHMLTFNSIGNGHSKGNVGIHGRRILQNNLVDN